MKLLVVNPNTSATVTERYLAEARRAAPAGVAITGVTGSFGADIVSTRAENIVAAHSALDLIARHGVGHDGIILAISFDSGLAAAADIMPVPVVGITRAALDAALRVGARVGLVLFGGMSLPLYDDLIAAYRLGEQVAAIEVVDLAGTDAYLADGGLDVAAGAAITRLVQRGDVGAIVLCGAAIVGIARRLQPLSPVPLFDGAAPAVADVIARAAGPPSDIRLRPLGRMTGVTPALAALICGGDPTSADPRSLPISPAKRT